MVAPGIPEMIFQKWHSENNNLENVEKIPEKLQSEGEKRIIEFRLILLALVNRSVEAKQIEEKLKFYQFSTEEIKYKKMIFDLIKTTKSFVENCTVVLENQILKLENSKL